MSKYGGPTNTHIGREANDDDGLRALHQLATYPLSTAQKCPSCGVEPGVPCQGSLRRVWASPHDKRVVADEKATVQQFFDAWGP